MNANVAVISSKAFSEVTSGAAASFSEHKEKRENSKENYFFPPSAASTFHFILYIRKQAIQAEENKVILGTFLDEGERVCAEHRRINQEALLLLQGGR